MTRFRWIMRIVSASTLLGIAVTVALSARQPLGVRLGVPLIVLLLLGAAYLDWRRE